MPLEIAYYVSCDNCRNYSSYLPVYNYVEALNHLRQLDWYFREDQASSYSTATKLTALCQECKGSAGEFRQGDRG